MKPKNGHHAANGHHQKNGHHAKTSHQPKDDDDGILTEAELFKILLKVRNGNFTVRLPDDQVGMLHATAAGARIEMPFPVQESTFDVIELRR